MSTRHHLLNLLADGAFHSGTVLGERLGISRAAVNKAVQSLVTNGFDIHRIPGRGYRLGEPFVPLSETPIRRELSARGIVSRVEVLEAVDSTSQYLLREFGADEANGRVCLSESQSAGRGRRGRGWIATPYQNLLLSIAWRFEFGPAAIAGLSLAAGVAVLQALEEFGVRDAGLKWPNDILLDGRKLAGLLVDVRGEVAGPSLAVLGMGLNVYLAAQDAALIDQPWATLVECVPAPVERNRLAALIIVHLVEMLRVFERTGFETFHTDWERRHVFAGRPVRLLTSREEVAGTVEGIDPQGGLRLRDASGRVQTFYSGEVSLRAGVIDGR